MNTSEPTPPGSLMAALLRGGIGFTLLSLAGFSVWAFGGRWFYARIGEAGMYAVSTVVFLGLSGPLLHPLLEGEGKVLRFYKIFVPAFLLYAVLWSACWFTLKFGLGEWLGSLLGCAAFALVLGKFLGRRRALPWVIFILFALHSAGYFAGGYAMEHLKPGAFPWLDGMPRRTIGTLGKLAWGFCYGLGFGLGIGHAFHTLQKR